MAISRQLLDILICPNCRHEKLEDSEENANLTCTSCHFTYRVADGVPVLLVDEAETKE